MDYGGITDINLQDEATEALVFQIISYTEKFKLPVAYFFTNKLTATLQSRLIKEAIVKLSEVRYVSDLLLVMGVLQI